MNKVDLFIPTYNRPDFLRRLLTYYNRYQVKYRIIVADSSSDANKKLNKKIVSEFKELNIIYKDKFSPKQISHQKFGEMVKFATAKYTVFCADDDFVIPSGIDRAVEFLEKNKNYATAHGTYISFYVNKNIPIAKHFLWRFIYPFKSINSSKADERLSEHILDYYQVLWAVRRTDVVKKAYSEFLKSKASPVLFGELLPDMLTIIYGKMKRIDAFYSARQDFSTSYGYWPSLQDSIKEGAFEKEFKLFKDCLIRNLPNSNLSKARASEIIDQNFEKYLKDNFQEHAMGQVNLFLKKLPVQFGDLVRKLHVLYLYSKENIGPLKNIHNSKSKYFNDFENIKQASIN